MIKRKCPNCGAVVESKFCTSCGQDLTGPNIIKICPNCGTETTSKFCTGCGTKLIEEQHESVAGSKTEDNVESGVSAAALYNRAKKIGAQKVKDLEKSAEVKRAQKEKEAEELKAKQAREAEQRKLQEIREAEERQRQIEKERKEAQEREELEKKKKLIEQKRIYEEATTYLNTATQSNDNAVSAKFYRKAEELFSSISGVADADEKSLFAARKAKEQEIIIETKKIKADQEAKEAAAAAKAAEEAKKAAAIAKAAEEAKAAEAAAKVAEETRPDESRTAEPEIINPTPTVKSDVNVSPQEKTGSKTVSTEKAPGKSKSKVIIAIVAIAVLAIAGVIFGMSRNGSNDTIQSEDLESAQTVSSEQIPTELVSADNLIVNADKATYTTGASDIRFEISAKNNTKDAIKIILTDVVIDDVTVPVDYDGSEDEIENGDWDISRDIYLTEIQDAGVTDFKNLTCSIIVLQDGKALQKTDFNLKREMFSDVEVNLSGDEVDNSDKTIEISKKNLAPVIAANDKYSIAVEECNYTNGDSLDVGLEVKNASKELMYIYMEDLMIDDSSIKTSRDVDPIQVGETYSGLYVFSDDLQAAGVEEFKEVSLTMVVKIGDEESLKQKIHITRDGFIDE